MIWTAPCASTKIPVAANDITVIPASSDTAQRGALGQLDGDVEVALDVLELSGNDFLVDAVECFRKLFELHRLVADEENGFQCCA